MLLKKNFLLLFSLCFHFLFAQNYYALSSNEIELNNGKVSRKIKIINDSIYSYHFSLNDGDKNFISAGKEFSFLLNGEMLNGFSGWQLIGTKKIQDQNNGSGICIALKGKNKWQQIVIELNYLLYPNFPVIRKWISITNNSLSEMKLEALQVEDLQTRLSQVSSIIYNSYGRMKSIGRFVGNWDDAIISLHNISERKGMVLGNEAPGVMKRTAFHSAIDDNIEIGLTMPSQDFPFRKWLKPAETWQSPKTFICLYENTDDGFAAINNTANEFVTQCMQPRVVKIKQKPTFVYNTWNPFRTFINDSLIRDVAKAASASGIQEFIIDDGWQVNDGAVSSTKGWGNNYGDWIVDKKKFPNGLKSTFDYIRSLGMKPGLWISIGSATKDAKVFKQHPEWFVKNSSGRSGNLHTTDTSGNFYTSCFGTDWFNYIKDVILRLVKDYGLAYAKLDLSVVTSAYTNDKNVSGCYATDHPYHKDHEESLYIIYDRVLKLFDELHEQAPDLFIDCTFETAGKLQLMDYAIAQHAEGNWLSNFEEPAPTGALRVRQMAWWRSAALPASSLVIGNQQMNDPDFEFSLESLIGTLPIVLGDPRALSQEKKAHIKKWSAWMKKMEEQYDYMSYRKDLPSFGEPREGAIDGWMRINFQKHSGGIFGVFRQGSLEDKRKIFLQDLDMHKRYIIRQAPDGKEILNVSGEELMQRGFEVQFEKLYEGKIFEVSPEF